MKKLTLILLSAATVLTMLSCNQKNDKISGFDELDAWAQDIVARKNNSFGYPVNMNIKLKEFYKWYIANDLDAVGMNNVGDPYSEGSALLGAHQFEREVIAYFADLYNFPKDNIWGLISNSGTDGNNHGIYFGVNYLKNKTGKLPVLYVSDEAHYSNARLADLQHIELRLIKSDAMGRMIPEEFEKALDTSRPCLVVYAMGSTFKGAIDDIDALNAVLDKHPEIPAYRHLDAALFGGYLPYTEHRDLVDVTKHFYNSIAISGHKFFGMDEPAGVFITTKDVYDGQSQFEIAYLNEDMKMINCSRSAVDVLKFWWLIKNVGTEQWLKDAPAMLENTKYFQTKLDELGWPNWANEYSNTIFFKRPSAELCNKYMLANNFDERFGGELSHIVVMQHMTPEVIDRFIEELKADQSK